MKALAFYVALSLFIFGKPALPDFSHRLIGRGADPQIEAWALAWWPHAVAKHINPFWTQAVWPTVGYNMTWTTSMPGPALAVSPITRAFGPVVSYNLLCIACPALAAFAAFTLCMLVCERFWPSLVGGYLFGFSQYILHHIRAHLHLLFIFPIPLAVYLALLRLRGRLGGAVFVSALAMVLSFEFLSSTEMFATTILFGSLTLAIAYWTCRDHGDILRLAGETAAACGITALAVYPYLYFVLVGGVPQQMAPPSAFSNDLLAFAWPDPQYYFSPRGAIESHDFSLYLGPALAIVLLYAWSFRSTAVGRFLMWTVTVVVVLSLGPQLHVGGHPVSLAPAWLLTRVPLLNLALPCRFGVYYSLAAAVMVALYLSHGPISVPARASMAVLALLFLAPNLTRYHDETFKPGQSNILDASLPSFFRDEYKRFLRPDDTVLILPYVHREFGLVWQAQTDFFFRLAAARLTLTPAEISGWPVLDSLPHRDLLVDFPRQLSAFLGAYQVKAIIVDIDQEAGDLECHDPERSWAAVLGALGWSYVHEGRIILYQVPSGVLEAFRTVTASHMAGEHSATLFATALAAVDRYVRLGYPIDQISANRLRELHLLDATESEPYVGSRNRLWVQAVPKDRLEIAVGGDHDAMAPLLEAFPAARLVDFPDCCRLSVVFEAADVSKAAALAQRALEKATRLP